MLKINTLNKMLNTEFSEENSGMICFSLINLPIILNSLNFTPTCSNIITIRSGGDKSISSIQLNMK